MPDYNKCSIYKLYCRDPEIEEFYIGSTTNPTKRKCDHKKCCTNSNDKEYNTYKYQFIRDHGGWLNWDLVVIEEFSCDSKMQQHKIERQYIENLKPSLNKTIPARYQTGDIYNVQEYKREHNKEYYEANKHKIRDQNKEYYEANKDKISEQKKVYREANKDKIKEQRREYYKNKKDKLSLSSSSSSSGEEQIIVKLSDIII